MSESDTGQMGPIIDELLCFVMNKYSILDRDTLVKLCSEKYTESDTKTSKDLLFGMIHGEGAHTMLKNRRHSKINESKKVKNLGDIYQLLQEKGTSDLPKFVAYDLSKLPPITYDSIDVSALLINTQNLQTDVEMLKDVLKQHCEVHRSVHEHNSMLQDRLFQLEKVVRVSGISIGLDDDQNDISALNSKSKDQKLFDCTKCEFSFHMEGELEMHMTIHAGGNDIDKDYECEECEYKCNIKDDFDKHILCHKNITVFRCPICIFESDSRSDLEKHLPIHNKENNNGSDYYKCMECDFKCDTENDMKAHSLTHLNDDMFVCPLCVHNCQTKEEMEIHGGTYWERCKYR